MNSGFVTLITTGLSQQKAMEEKRTRLNEEHEQLKMEVDELMKMKDCESHANLTHRNTSKECYFPILSLC